MSAGLLDRIAQPADRWKGSAHSAATAIATAVRLLRADKGAGLHCTLGELVAVCSELVYRATGERIRPAIGPDDQSAKVAQAQQDDAGAYVACVRLPRGVILSEAYRGLPGTAVKLLMDIAVQFDGTNNGRLVATRRSLAALGWTSHDVVERNLAALQAAGLLIETRSGGPNRSALYALAWCSLNTDHATPAGGVR